MLGQRGEEGAGNGCRVDGERSTGPQVGSGGAPTTGGGPGVRAACGGGGVSIQGKGVS